MRKLLAFLFAAVILAAAAPSLAGGYKYGGHKYGGYGGKHGSYHLGAVDRRSAQHFGRHSHDGYKRKYRHYRHARKHRYYPRYTYYGGYDHRYYGYSNAYRYEEERYVAPAPAYVPPLQPPLYAPEEESSYEPQEESGYEPQELSNYIDCRQVTDTGQLGGRKAYFATTVCHDNTGQPHIVQDSVRFLGFAK
jgi:hypothetical protein